MTESVIGLTETEGVRQGYRVVTESAGWEYRTELRRVDDEDDEEKIVECVDRYRVDQDTLDEEEIDHDVTEAVEEALEKRGVQVR